MKIWQNNKVWIIASLVLAVGFYTLSVMGVDDNSVASTVTLGIVFLVLTLVPNNLLRLQLPFLQKATPYLARIVKYRRDLGIIAGLLFVTHAILAIMGVKAFSEANGMPFDVSFLGSKPIILGTFAIIVILLLLLTSSNFIHTHLGSKWKVIQSLVWLSVPLALVHSLLAANEPSSAAILGFGLIIALVVVEMIIYSRKPPVGKTNYIRHIWFVSIGIIIAVATLVFMK